MICRVCNYVLLCIATYFIGSKPAMFTFSGPSSSILVSFLESFICIRVDLCLQKILVTTSGPFHVMLHVLLFNFGCPVDETLFYHGGRTCRIAKHGVDIEWARAICSTLGKYQCLESGLRRHTSQEYIAVFQAGSDKSLVPEPAPLLQEE